jgi:hypothetical protein
MELKSTVLKQTAFNHSQISALPCSHNFTDSVVTDLGLSSGKFNALSQHKLASTPNARLTANNTV